MQALNQELKMIIKILSFIDEIQNVHSIQNPYVESKDIITFVDVKC